MMRTANPALNENTFLNVHDQAYGGQTMTIEGTVSKSGILLMLVMASAAFTWRGYLNGSEQVMLWMIGGLIGGLVLGLVTSFKPAIAMYTAPIYALCEGLFLGGVSAQVQVMSGQAIVIQAVALTFGILLALLFVYRLGLIKATENFKLGRPRPRAVFFWPISPPSCSVSSACPCPSSTNRAWSESASASSSS